MKLRRITALCSLLITAFFMVSMLMVCRRILLRNYATLEHEDVTQHVGGIIAIVRSEITNLSRTANDYASWDQTFNYMKHPNQRYINSELSSDTLTSLGVHLLMLVDRKGRVALLERYGKGRSISTYDVRMLQSTVRMSATTTTGDRTAGLIELAGGPAVVVVRPILPTGGKGQSRGTLVLLRMIDDRLLLQWSAVTTIPFQVSGIPSSRLANTLQAPVQTTSLPLIVYSSDKVLSVRSKLADLWGQPNFTISFRYSRQIWQEGRDTVQVLVLILGALGIVFGFVNLCLMDRFVVVRIQRLIRFTHDIRGKAGLTARTPVWGDDEISQLGTQMNRMLEQLESSQHRLMETQEQLMFEATHDHLTGSFNRAAVVDFLGRELSRASREQKSVGVILIDVDHFKKINDRFGHAATEF